MGEGNGEKRSQAYPRYIPAPPAPAQILPKTRAPIDGAPPHSALPAANMVTAVTNSHLTSKMAKALPVGKIITEDPKPKPKPSHPSREMSSNVSDTLAWMSAVMVVSRPYSRLAEKTARQTRSHRKPLMDRS